MKKISLGGISVALLIGLFYTFVFCMIGNTDNGGLPTSGTLPETYDSVVFDNEEPEYTETPSISDESELYTATETSEQFLLSAAQSSLKASGEQVQGEGKEEETVTLYTTTVTATTTPERTTAPVTTTAPITTTTKATTTTPIVTTTTVTTTTTVATTTTPMTTTTPITTTTPAATTTPITTTNRFQTETVPPEKTTVPETTALQTTTPETTVAPPAPVGKLSYTVNGTKYRSDAFDVICQIVNAEMGPSFHEEALKAQAVAAYSYLRYSNERGVSPSVALKGNVPKKVSDAVSEVIGRTIYYNGSVAQTVYSASSGGYTASAKDVWGTHVPYLVSVEGKYDQNDRYYGSVKTFTKAEVKSMIESSTGISLSDSPENWITLLPTEQGGVADGGYVGKLLIDGNSSYTRNGRTVQITGRVMRETIFAFRLRSSKFTVDYADGVFTFTTYGYGHGVGMSQLGANEYAVQGGYDYRQILEHYYTGITIK